MLSVTNAECHKQAFFAECRYAECQYAECQYAECQYDECQYSECRGAVLASSYDHFLFVRGFLTLWDIKVLTKH